ncbi:acid protease [Lactarius quietus]|nr:acid protease [Lactarius quietus]
MYASATLIIIILSIFVEATPKLSGSGFALPILKHSRVRDANGGVNLDRLKRSVTHSITKINHRFQAYEQNTGVPYPSAPQMKRSEKRDIQVQRDPIINLDWYSYISVGTPAKNFTVSIDTGSSDIFLPSTACKNSCMGHRLFDPSQSSTEHDLGTPFYLEYGNGPESEVNGTLYTDDVTIAGYTAWNQTFGAASNYSVGFTYPGWQPDGILGLAFPSLSMYGATPLFTTLVDQDVLPTNSFGLCPTELFIGGTNSQLYKGNFTYVPVTQEAFWETNIDALYLNGQKIASTINTIIDSGTAMILGDNKTVQAFYNQIPGAYPIGSGFYNIPCSFDSEISFQFNATSFVIQPKTFNFGNYSSNPNDCLGGFVGTDQFTQWTLGEVFLDNVYAEFDVENKRLGFALLT